MIVSRRDETSGPWRLTRRAGWVIALLVGASFLNYLDRQVLSILKPVIKAEFGLDDSGYATIVNVFTFCYAAAYIGTGWVIDRFGVRAAYAAFVGVWSFATLLGGVARSLPTFTFARGLLGLAEPAHAPTTIRVGVLWFPPERRAFLMSVAAWGGTIGAVAAPPLISWMALTWSWRAAFIVPGFVGLVLSIVWWFFYRDPVEAAASRPDARPTAPWGSLWCRPALWGIVLARLISDPVWYFCLFWMPGYFQEERGLSLKDTGLVGWIPFLAGNLGALACAALSDRLVARLQVPARARVALLAGLTLFAPLTCLVPHLSGMPAVLTLLSVTAIVCIGWFAALGPLATDIFPAGNAASVWAIAGAFGAVGAMVFNHVIGHLTSSLGIGRMFLVLGCLHPLGLLILWLSLKLERRNP